MVDRKNEPLYFALVKLFTDGRCRTVDDALLALEPRYGRQRLFTYRGIAEALATAKENGLLSEASYGLDARGELVVHFQITDYGAQMIERYLR